MTTVRVYKSRKTPELYLYVDAEEDLDRVPEALLSRFGRPQVAMSLELSADRHLARVDASVVLSEIEDSGFYLQLPPDPAAWNR